jgi:hypothetical protein
MARSLLFSSMAFYHSNAAAAFRIARKRKVTQQLRIRCVPVIRPRPLLALPKRNVIGTNQAAAKKFRSRE